MVTYELCITHMVNFPHRKNSVIDIRDFITRKTSKLDDESIEDDLTLTSK